MLKRFVVLPYQPLLQGMPYILHAYIMFFGMLSQSRHDHFFSVQGTCLEEAARIEEFFDTARARVEWLSSRQEITERRFTNHRVPWDRSVFKATRHASLHLAVIYMSRYSSKLGLVDVGFVAVHSMACKFTSAA